MLDNFDLAGTNVGDNNKDSALNSMTSVDGLEPIIDNKKSEFEEGESGDFSIQENDNTMMMTPINQPSEIEEFQTPIRSSDDEEMMTPIVDDNDDVLGGFSYLENEHNFEIPKFSKEDIDDVEPFSNFKMAGKWIREAVDVDNYRKAIESMGEEVAKYKWAFDQGEMGEFNLKDFSSEVVKSGARSIGVNTLNMAGNIMSMMGANLKVDDSDINSDSVVRKNILPKMSDAFLKLGKTLKDYAAKVDDIEFLAPSDEVYNEDPSFARLANVLGSGASQVLMMGAMSKAIGSVATYGLYSAGSGSEVFAQSYEQDNDLSKANALAVANAGISFAIDKIFSPLPDVVEKNAKVTAKMIADDMLGAPLKEAGTEILQQMLAENLVRKIGIDDSQDLFEGLIESALGSFMGSAVLVGANGVSYASNRALEQVHERMALRGVSEEDFELAKNNMLAFMESKPESFERVLSYNLNENLKRLEEEAKTLENKVERKKTLSEIKKFDEVYEKMKSRFLEATGDEQKSSLAAKLFEANAMTLYEVDKSFSPEKYIGGLLPEVKSMEFDEFKKLNKPEDSVLYHFVGVNAKDIDLNKLAMAYRMEQERYVPHTIWSKTGWIRDADGKFKMEVSDEGARIKIFEEIVDDYVHEGISSSDFSVKEIEAIEKEMSMHALKLKEYNDMFNEGVYWDFVQYLDGQNFDDFWEDSNLYDETTDKRLNEVDEYFEVANARIVESAKLEAVWRRYNKKPRNEDFSEEETKYIMGRLEKNKYNKFIKDYFKKRNILDKDSKATLDRDKFGELKVKKYLEYKDNEEFFDAISKIEKDIKEKIYLRFDKLKEVGKENELDLYDDIMNEKYFRLYKVYMGDFSDNNIDMNYRPDSFKKAFEPSTLSEKFLNNAKYRFLNNEQNNNLEIVFDNSLITMLDRIQELYRLQKQREHILDTDRARIIRENAVRNYNAYDENTRFRNERKAIEFKKVQNGMEMKLSDIMEHDLLYKNYPNLRDMKVLFTEIEDDAPYHFYHNDEEGYVMEVDANQIDFENFKDVFLLGASFAIQDIEKFDYTLNRYQQKNFMDRNYYMAKRDTEGYLISAVEKFVEEMLPEYKVADFIFAKEVPVSLLGLSRSMAKGSHNKKVENINYKDVNFDKLESALRNKYMRFNSSDSSYVFDSVYQKFFNIKNSIAHMITTYARAKSGYEFAGLPWSGIIAQGSMDARAMLKRNNNDNDLVDLHWEMFMPQLMQEVTSDRAELDQDFEADITKDKEILDETLNDLAKGAYDEADKTILLFKDASIETILHETFHYFSDVVEKANLRDKDAFADFYEAMDVMKKEFLIMYNIYKSDNNLYYAYNDDDNELVDFMPIGFTSQKALLEAGAKELMVDKISRMIRGKILDVAADETYEGVWLFCRWLKNVTKMLKIDGRKTGKGGSSVLKFIAKKLSRLRRR